MNFHEAFMKKHNCKVLQNRSTSSQ